jgi:hypothetical protein
MANRYMKNCFMSLVIREMLIKATMNLLPARTAIMRVWRETTARHWWFTFTIPANQEAEIKRIMVQSQPRQKVYQTLF